MIEKPVAVCSSKINGLKMTILLIETMTALPTNLFHYLGELGAQVRVARNDELGAREALALAPEAIVLSRPAPAPPTRRASVWN